MDNTDNPRQHFPRKAAVAAGILLLVLVVCYSLLQSVARSPFVTSLAERYLADLLQQPVSLQAVNLHFGTISVKGLTVGRPAGAAAGGLAAVRSASIRPSWSELLSGKRVVKEITVSGVSIDLIRDGQGEWNFAPLLRALQQRKGKGEPAELLIHSLRLKDGSLSVNGYRLDRLSIDATDIATKGSSVMRFAVKGNVPAAGSISLSGAARLGSQPVADVAFEAPSLSLADMPSPERFTLPKAKGNLMLMARLRDGNVTGDLTAGAAGIGVKLERKILPLALQLRIPFSYDRTTDTLAVEPSRLQVNRLLTLHGSATLEGVRGARKFVVRLHTDSLQIADAAAALPGVLPAESSLGGRLLPLRLYIAGEAGRGITDAQGDVSVRDGVFIRRNKPMVEGLAADFEIRKRPDGWQLHGRIDGADSPGPVPIGNLSATFSGRFDKKMRPVEFRASDVKARVAGSDMTGLASLKPSAPVPFTASAEIPNISLRELNDFLREKGEIISGEAAAAVEVAGRSPADFTGKINLDIRNATGKTGAKSFSAGRLNTVASIRRADGAVTVDGEMAAKEGVFAGKPLHGDFRYGATADSFFLGNGHIGWGDMEVGFERFAGKLPLHRDRQGTMPVRFEYRGVTWRRGDIEVRGMSGVADGAMGRADGPASVAGRADIADAVVSFRRTEVGTVGARLVFAGSRGEAKISGTLLGGKVAANLLFDPSAGNGTINVDGNIVRAEAAKLSGIGAFPASFRASGGTLGAAVRGSYATTGINGEFSFSGEDLSLISGKKTVVTSAGFTLRGQAAGDTVTIQEGRGWAGPDLKAMVSGEVTRALSAERQGTLRVQVPTIQVASLFDTFANVLPRPLQESTAAGTLAVDSTVRLQGRQQLLQGKAAISSLSVEVPAQQFSVTGIRGTVPFSVDMPGTSSRGQVAMQHPSRDSYSGYLYFLQYGPHRGELLAIDRIRFGAVELGDAALRLEATDGMIRINSFSASLAEGVLVGRGYFGPGSAGNYGGDLLVNDFSLRAFCSMIPALNNYISGKVDGIVSVAGTGKGVTGMNAFIDLWARGTKKEKMLVSKEFLQKLAGKNIRGLFFRTDRPYDRGEIIGYLEKGYLTFDTLDISHTNFFGVKDLSVSVAPVQNKIALDHLIGAVKQAAARGKGAQKEAQQPPAEFSWEE